MSSFGVAGTAQSSQLVCRVLTLTLGPLDLNLLGLRVQLNQVNLRITAIPGGGLLGDLLCGLANLLNPPALGPATTSPVCSTPCWHSFRPIRPPPERGPLSGRGGRPAAPSTTARLCPRPTSLDRVSARSGGSCAWSARAHRLSLDQRWATALAAWTGSAAVSCAASCLPAISSVRVRSHRERAARVSGCRRVNRIIWTGSSV